MSQENQEINTKDSLSYLQSINHIVYELNESNIETSIDEIINLDTNYSYSINLELCHLIFSFFVARKGNIHVYLRFLKKLQKEESEKLFDQNPIEIFYNYITNRKRYNVYESIYLMEMLIEDGYYSEDIIKNIRSLFFIHHRPNLSESKELHKKLFHEGVNPTKIAEVLRNDDIEQLQELSTLKDFSFNQQIERSQYESCFLLKHPFLLIIDYAAFFSSIKCFKFLLMNGANVNNTGKYAVAGGNIEIIHLCEQNHSSFKGAYEIAIIFHRNDVFRYIYENKLDEIDNLQELGKKCIIWDNFEILTFLMEKNLEINDEIINKCAKNGNLFLLKYFLENHQTPKNILVYATRTSNYELVEFVAKKDGIDINAKSKNVIYDLLVFIFMFYDSFNVSINWKNC